MPPGCALVDVVRERSLNRTAASAIRCPCLQQVDHVSPSSNLIDDLRHEFAVSQTALKGRLDAVGLTADAVNRRQTLRTTLRFFIDAVRNVKPGRCCSPARSCMSFEARVCRREQHALGAGHGPQRLADHDGGRAIVLKPVRQDSSFGWCRSWFNLLSRRRARPGRKTCNVLLGGIAPFDVGSSYLQLCQSGNNESCGQWAAASCYG